MSHCRGCIGFVQRKERDLYGKLVYEVGDDCPGCPSCATMQAKLEAAIDSRQNWKALFTKVHEERDTLQAKLDEATGRSERLYDLWNRVEIKNDSLRSRLAEVERERDDAALAQARAEEREACAKIAEEHICGCGDHSTEVSRMIRERGTP